MGAIRMFLAVLVAVSAFAGAAQPQPDAAPAAAPGHDGVLVARVAALEASRRRAMVAANVAALDTIMTRDATYVHSTGLVQTREELLAMLSRGDIRYLSFTVDREAFRAYATTVVGTGVQAIELSSAGKALTSRSRYTVVYVSEAGRLRLAAYQSTPLPDPVPPDRVQQKEKR